MSDDTHPDISLNTVMSFEGGSGYFSLLHSKFYITTLNSANLLCRVSLFPRICFVSFRLIAILHSAPSAMPPCAWCRVMLLQGYKNSKGNK